MNQLTEAFSHSHLPTPSCKQDAPTCFQSLLNIILKARSNLSTGKLLPRQWIASELLLAEFTPIVCNSYMMTDKFKTLLAFSFPLSTTTLKNKTHHHKSTVLPQSHQ